MAECKETGFPIHLIWRRVLQRIQNLQRRNEKPVQLSERSQKARTFGLELTSSSRNSCSSTVIHWRHPSGKGTLILPSIRPCVLTVTSSAISRRQSWQTLLVLAPAVVDCCPHYPQLIHRLHLHQLPHSTVLHLMASPLHFPMATLAISTLSVVPSDSSQICWYLSLNDHHHLQYPSSKPIRLPPYWFTLCRPVSSYYTSSIVAGTFRK